METGVKLMKSTFARPPLPTTICFHSFGSFTLPFSRSSNMLSFTLTQDAWMFLPLLDTFVQPGHSCHLNLTLAIISSEQSPPITLYETSDGLQSIVWLQLIS